MLIIGLYICIIFDMDILYAFFYVCGSSKTNSSPSNLRWIKNKQLTKLIYQVRSRTFQKI